MEDCCDEFGARDRLLLTDASRGPATCAGEPASGETLGEPTAPSPLSVMLVPFSKTKESNRQAR